MLGIETKVSYMLGNTTTEPQPPQMIIIRARTFKEVTTAEKGQRDGPLSRMTNAMIERGARESQAQRKLPYLFISLNKQIFILAGILD